jgi:hypothetical protein
MSPAVVVLTVAMFTIRIRRGVARRHLKVTVMTRTSAGAACRADTNAVVQAPLIDANVRPAGAGSFTVTLSATEGRHS